MVTILDHRGMPMRKRDLDKPVAGPTLAGVRQVISDHPANGLTPERLARIHREAHEGEPMAFFELAEDIEERDLHYAGIMATRKRSVAQLPITVEPVSDSPDHKEHADFVQSWVKDDVLRAALFDMLDAIGKGVSIMEIDWREHGGYWCPAEFIYRTQRWFTFDRLDGETVLMRDNEGPVPIAAHKFVVHRHKAKSGLTIRSGLTRIASWAWMFKAFTAKDWAIFCQNYGAPIRVGKYGRGATEDEKDVLWRAVANIAGDCAAIVPADMMIEFHEVAAKGTSTDLYERRADWLDRQMSKAVLGQTTTTDAVSGGHAVAQEHRLVQEDIERADALVLSATINRQIVPNLVAFNFGPQSHYPKIRVGRPDEVPLAEFAAAFSQLAPHGLTAGQDYIRGRMGIPTPKGDSDLIGGRPTPPTAPEPNPPEQMTARQLFSQTSVDEQDALVDALTTRARDDAAGALAGLTDQVRAVLFNAKTLQEAADGLAALDLDRDALAEAMARGMALAQLAGQASLIDDLRRQN